jgi:hypothetical protein
MLSFFSLYREDGDYEFQLRSASGMTLMLKAEKESDKARPLLSAYLNLV